MRFTALVALLAGCGPTVDSVQLSDLVSVTVEGAEAPRDLLACCDGLEARVAIVVTESAPDPDYSHLLLQVRDAAGDLTFLADGEPLDPGADLLLGARVRRESVTIEVIAPCGFGEGGFWISVVTVKKGLAVPDYFDKSGSADFRVLEEGCLAVVR